MRANGIRVAHSGRWVVGLALALAALVWVGSSLAHHPGRPARAAPAAADVFHGVNQAALARCLARQQNCAATVPGLAHCMKHYLVCNQSPARAAPNLGANLSVPVAAGTPPITKAEAEKGLAAEGTITQALLTTYGAIHRALPSLAASDIINPTRPVWVITVHYPSPQLFQGSQPSGLPSEYFNWYRQVVDAASGVMTDDAMYGNTPPPISPAIGRG